MKSLQKFFALGLCLALAAGLAACENAPVSSAQPSSSGASSSAAEPVSAPTAAPASKPADSFEAAFAQNPIDQAFQADSDKASSPTMLYSACNAAANSWQKMVNIAYSALLQAVPEDGRDAAEQEQSQWMDGLDAEIEAIRATAGDSDEEALVAARKTVDLYRNRVLDLSRQLYSLTGALPDFSAAAVEPAG